MRTTTLSQTDRSFINGFPRITDVPESLQSFFAKLRSLHDTIKVDFSNSKTGTIDIKIFYSRNFTLTSAQVLQVLLKSTIILSNYKYSRIDHSNYVQTHIILTERTK